VPGLLPNQRRRWWRQYCLFPLAVMVGRGKLLPFFRFPKGDFLLSFQRGTRRRGDVRVLRWWRFGGVRNLFPILRKFRRRGGLILTPRRNDGG